MHFQQLFGMVALIRGKLHLGSGPRNERRVCQAFELVSYTYLMSNDHGGSHAAAPPQV